jgi:hypothetical protein
MRGTRQHHYNQGKRHAQRSRQPQHVAQGQPYTTANNSTQDLSTCGTKDSFADYKHLFWVMLVFSILQSVVSGLTHTFIMTGTRSITKSSVIPEEGTRAQKNRCLNLPIKLRGCASGDEMTPKTRTALAPKEAYSSGRLNTGSNHCVRPDRSRIPQKAPPLHITLYPLAHICCALCS